MTRQDFIDGVNDFQDLLNFCSDEGCCICEDIYYSYSYDEYINECLSDWAREDDWRDLMRRLNNLPTGYDWYIDDGDWRGLDDGDFDDYKDDVLEWADDNDVWDAEEENNADDAEDAAEEVNEPEEEADESEPEDGCSLDELFMSSTFITRRVETDESDDDEAEAMIQMLMYS